ncbi:zinc transporter ZIP13 [Gadus macrocephalus]|uniref:zinc transporter ZIP13 n=1 Tax=Gadus macrocephalus TaxID=80720 RepID=UPI0028CB9FF0|nr:zinc transporter ZIP13 [Gadus macrocephalus]XP_059926959.1 zinc transporter ZIP13 [Gadus macrocephalus]
MKVAGRGKPSWALATVFVGVTLMVLTSRCASSNQKMSQTAMGHSTDRAAGQGNSLLEELLGFQGLADLFASEQAEVWLYSLVGSIVVGLSGIFPLLVIPIEAGAALKTEAGGQKLKQLLSFAIGGLLGDVFLHLLPEAWTLCNQSDGSRHHHYMVQGLWVIVGLLSFLILEKMFPDQNSNAEPDPTADLDATSSALSGSVIGGNTEGLVKNGKLSDLMGSSKPQQLCTQSGSHTIKTSGYLNLLANCIDNFTHGLAVAGSFLVSKKVGFLTTFAILLHEIPHEVGDFAILLRAGFDRWSAARMQLTTALVGVLGASTALCCQSPQSTDNATAWILPFTSGGFLYIALVNVVPDLLEESNVRHSLMQVGLICLGVAVMALLSFIVD